MPIVSFVGTNKGKILSRSCWFFIVESVSNNAGVFVRYQIAWKLIIECCTVYSRYGSNPVVLVIGKFVRDSFNDNIVSLA